ncbi:MAG: hypothetical protein H0U45_16790 [Tatlockia sp.]|nr:hypothetical protein [Tatlockia sp.]
MNKKQINQRVTIRHQEELTLLQEHRQMISAVKQLPSSLFIARTQDQKIWLKDRKNFWVWMGLRLNYLQLKQLGFQPVDPIDNPDFDPRQRESLDLFSSYLFQILQVIIKGFSFIKDAASHEKRDFPFNNARELFIEICRDWVKSGLEDAFIEGIDRGSELKQVRTAWTTISKFYRGRLSEDYTGKSVCKNELNEEQILSDLKNSDWFGFWQFAVFKHRFQELREPWKEFLKTHKNLCNFIHETKPKEGTTLKMLKWNSGYAVHSDTNSPAKFNDSLHFLTPE